jgi:hypothetical protein
MGTDDTLGKVKDPVVSAIRWVKSRSPREKMYMMAGAGVMVRAESARTAQEGAEDLEATCLLNRGPRLLRRPC